MFQALIAAFEHEGDSTPPQLNSTSRSDWNASPVSLKLQGILSASYCTKKVQNGSTCAIVASSSTDIFCAIAR